MSADASGPVEQRVAVFGSSEVRPDEAAYDTARSTGRVLGRAGYCIVTGGYGGVMEAASRGAREAGARTIGVTCAEFADRRPNAFLTEVRACRDLHDRTRELIRLAHAFVVLPGKAGTLAELAFLWALHRAGCLDRRPVVLLGVNYAPLIRHLERHRLLDAAEARINHVAATPEQAVELLGSEIAGKRSR